MEVTKWLKPSISALRFHSARVKTGSIPAWQAFPIHPNEQASLAWPATRAAPAQTNHA
jgi:hypothetical protein